MAVTLYHIERRPGQQQFGLDTFTDIYKANEKADLVMIDASVPQRGDAHPDYPFMFVTDRYFNESGTNACACDIVYMGCMKGEGSPELPPPQTSGGASIQSASSQSTTTALPLPNPVTLQYYAPESVLNYISYSAPGTDVADDPTGDPVIISLTFYLATVAGITAAEWAAIMFITNIVETPSNQEIVAGKFWQNTSRKTKVFIPAGLSTSTDGIYLQLTAPGSGYAVSDTLTFTGSSGAASVTVTAVNAVGGVIGWEVTSITFTAVEAEMTASGGSGSGCKAIGVSTI